MGGGGGVEEGVGQYEGYDNDDSDRHKSLKTDLTLQFHIMCHSDHYGL